MKGGADEIVNYRSENVALRIQEATRGHAVDALIDVDLSSNAALYPSILAAHATVVVYGMSASSAHIPSLWMMQKSISLRLFLVYDISSADRERNISQLQGLLARGELAHTVGRRLPLRKIAEAHEIVERGEVIGNVVLDIPVTSAMEHTA